MRLRRLSPSGQRRLVGLGFLAFFAGTIYWSFFSDGLPIIWGPSARASEIAAGNELFEHEWTANDPLAHGAAAKFANRVIAATADEHEQLRQRIQELPSELQEVLYLHYYDQMSYDEMAGWLGVARATVNERLAKARGLLRVRLSSSGGRANAR